MNTGYVILLPRELANPWPSDLIAYWRSLGDRVGAEVAPIRPPEIFHPLNSGQDLETRALQIRPEVVLTCQPVDLNIVLEHLNLAEADRHQHLHLLRCLRAVAGARKRRGDAEAWRSLADQ